MQDACIIKSNNKGLTLVLSDTVSFEDLVVAVCAKFAKSKHFFGQTDLILMVEGRELTGEEIAVLVEAIEINSDIHITLIERNDTLFDARMAQREDRFYFDEFYQNAKIVPGAVARDEEVYSDGSILILGDVKRGGLVRARGHVIVVGDVRGEIVAGAEGEKSAYVVANFFDTQAITIADVTGAVSTPQGGGLFRRAPKEPVAVVLWEGSLLTEPLSNGIIKQMVK